VGLFPLCTLVALNVLCLYKTKDLLVELVLPNLGSKAILVLYCARLRRPRNVCPCLGKGVIVKMTTFKGSQFADSDNRMKGKTKYTDLI
jgi:hypothetical protein